MAFGSIAFGFLAGILATLSPCVLPLLPLVLGTAVAAHRFGLAALTSGLVLAYVGVGLFAASVGFSIGLDGDWFRAVAAALLGGIGAVLLSSTLQTRFALATGAVSRAGSRLMAVLSPGGLGGQFLLGLLLGAVWSPCVGPTLGAASLLAAQGRDLFGVASVMLAFGLGTALPLLLVGHISRASRLRLLRAGQTGRGLLGGAAMAVAALALTGGDRVLEAGLVRLSPAWLTALTTQF